MKRRVPSPFHRLVSLDPQAILYSFPAVCWIYGAGFIFSTFVSVVFWGNPIMNAYQTLRNNSSTIRIKALKVGRFVQGGRHGQHKGRRSLGQVSQITSLR